MNAFYLHAPVNQKYKGWLLPFFGGHRWSSTRKENVFSVKMLTGAVSWLPG